jgi:hypothetical protein
MATLPGGRAGLLLRNGCRQSRDLEGFNLEAADGVREPHRPYRPITSAACDVPTAFGGFDRGFEALPVAAVSDNIC